MPKPSKVKLWLKVTAIMDAITCRLGEVCSLPDITANKYLALRDMREVLEGLPSEQLLGEEVRSLLIKLYLVELPIALQHATYSWWLMLEAAFGLELVVMRGLCRGHEQAVLGAFEVLVRRCCNRPRCTRIGRAGDGDPVEGVMLNAVGLLIETELADDRDSAIEMQLSEDICALQQKLLLDDMF